MTDLIIGLDLGTSTYKAVAFDLNGAQIAEASTRPDHRHLRPGWVDQDPSDLVMKAAMAVRALIDDGIPANRVRAIGLTGQLGGMVLVGADGSAIGEHEVWLDSRCHAERDKLMSAHGAEILELAGIQPFMAPRLVWRATERPVDLRHAGAAVQCWPYVAMQFTGLTASEAFNDSTSIGIFGTADVRAGAWSQRLCTLSGVDIGLMPRIVEPWTVVGEVSAHWAAVTGLRTGTPVVAGCGDGIAGWIGCGATAPGIAIDTVGSSDHFCFALGEYIADPEHQVLSTLRSVIPGLWHTFGYTAGSGLSHRWFIDTLGCPSPGATEEDAWQEMEEAAAEVRPGSEGLLFIPHLEGRFCPFEPNIRGVWHGFTWSHTRPHFYRSILESVAYEYAHYVRSARRIGVTSALTEVRVVGGGARSGLWNSIKADVLGVPYSELAPMNYAARGASLCAAYGIGLIDDLASAAQREVTEVKRFLPDRELTLRYQPFVERYLQLLEDLEPSFASVASDHSERVSSGA